MKDYAPALADHLLLEVATPATCWQIELRDGTIIRGTDHDEDIVVPAMSPDPFGLAGTYKAAASISGSDIRTTADMAVDNMEVTGAMQSDVLIPDLTPFRIEAGLCDRAPVIVFFVNWQAPEDGYGILRRGYLGEFTRDSNQMYRSEVRGMTQLLSQNIGRTYGERCDVKRFGDDRCKLDLAPLTRTGVIATVTNRRQFTVTLTPGTDPPTSTYFYGGALMFTSGENDNLEREVKTATVTGGVATVDMWEELPADIEVGDTLTLEPGCDRNYVTCRDVFGNVINMRADGLFIPGLDALTKGPT